MDGYDACQRYKNRSKAPAGKLMPNAILEKPWSHISADFITKLPLAQGYDAILVVCDRFSKMAHFIATTEKTSAEGLAKLFRDHVWKLHGLPESIVSDRRVQFAAGMMKELNSLLGISNKTFNGLPPTNRWADRKSESGVRTVPKGFYRPQTRTMAGLARNGRICIQQQNSHSNKSVAIQSKLWSRPKDGI